MKLSISFQTLPAVSKYQKTFLKYLISLEPFYDTFDFQSSRNITPPIPIFQSKESTLYTKQDLKEHLKMLLFTDPDIYPLTRATTLKATQSTLYSPIQVAATLYLNIYDPSTTLSNLHQSLQATLSSHDKTTTTTSFVFIYLR